jgi:ABC-type proline/glycine betaine transport system permease subunit
MLSSGGPRRGLALTGLGTLTVGGITFNQISFAVAGVALVAAGVILGRLSRRIRKSPV